MSKESPVCFTIPIVIYQRNEIMLNEHIRCSLETYTNRHIFNVNYRGKHAIDFMSFVIENAINFFIFPKWKSVEDELLRNSYKLCYLSEV